MRLAYVAPYQGPDLLSRRSILSNLALAANVKMEVISELLTSKGHDVEIISQGEPGERSFRYYPGFQERRPFHSGVPVTYASTVPIKFITGFWSSNRTLDLFRKRHRAAPFDALIIYNLKGPQLACASYAIHHLGIPTIVEYEDDSFVDVLGKEEEGVRVQRLLRSAAATLKSASGCIGVSPHILSPFDPAIQRLLLRGVVDDEI